MSGSAETRLAHAARLYDEGMLDDAIALAWAAADAGAPQAAHELVAACARAKAASERMLHVVLAGDSLALPRPARTSDYAPPEHPELSTPRGATVAFLLEQRLRRESGRPATVSLRAQASHGIRDVVADLPLTLGYLDPDALVVLVGWVDVWLEDGERPRLSARDFEAGVDELVSRHRALAPGRKLILVGMPAAGDAVLRHRPHAGEWVAVFNEILRDAVSAPAEFVDLAALGGQSSVHGDGVHLSAAGHARLADALAPRLTDAALHTASLGRPELAPPRRAYSAGLRHPVVGVELGGIAGGDGGGRSGVASGGAAGAGELVAGAHRGDGLLRVSAEQGSASTVSLGARSSLVTWTAPPEQAWQGGGLVVEVEALILGAGPDEGVIRIGDGRRGGELRLGATSSALPGGETVEHPAGEPLAVVLRLDGDELVVEASGVSRRAAAVPGPLLGVEFGIDRPSGADSEIVWRRVRVRAGR